LARLPDDIAHRRELLREMLRVRRFEERCVELYSATKIRGFLHLYIGEEAVAVGVCQALTPEDSIVATYREHGHALARGVGMDSLMAEIYGKVTGCSRGRGGSMHLFDTGHRFYGGTRSSAAGCRSRSAWHSPTGCAATAGSPSASLGTAPWRKASFTSA